MTVAIIGGGPAGIVSAKEALACGLEPTVFEQGNTIGGLWKPEGGKVWDSMQTNISHHTCAFSDFEWPEDTPDFPNQSDVYQYLCKYADIFNIHQHVVLNCKVNAVKRVNSQWIVERLDKTGQRESSNFDHVIVCSGFFSKAFIPSITGFYTFSGSVIHSDEYKTPAPFEDMIVTIIGGGFSGCEIAVDLAQTAKKVYSVIQRSMWVLPRYLPKDSSSKPLPGDLIFYSRAAESRSEGIAPAVTNGRKNSWFNGICHDQSRICPDLAVPVPSSDPQFVAISDSFLPKIEVGEIHIQKGSIQLVEGQTLHMSGGNSIETDALVFCTGYRAEIPFFDEGMQKQLGFHGDDPLQPFLMHNTVFHPDFPNGAFVGMYRGPFFGVIELQARMACMTFSGKIPLPQEKEMQEGIKMEQQIRDATPRPQFPHGDYVRFSDDLAKQIGVLPDFAQMRSENPVLYHKLWDGPFTPASFRLTGFGSNPRVALKIIERINLAAK